MQKMLKQISDVPILESNRLILKPLSTEFLSQEYVNWMNDKEVIKFMESGGEYNFAKLNKYLQENESIPKFFWAITLKISGKHIGNIKIDPINYLAREAEYGIMIGDKTNWGKGYAEEASNLVLSYCFSSLKLNKINLGVKSANKKAIKLYKKLGFKIQNPSKFFFMLKVIFFGNVRMVKLNYS